MLSIRNQALSKHLESVPERAKVFRFESQDPLKRKIASVHWDSTFPSENFIKRMTGDNLFTRCIHMEIHDCEMFAFLILQSCSESENRGHYKKIKITSHNVSGTLPSLFPLIPPQILQFPRIHAIHLDGARSNLQQNGTFSGVRIPPLPKKFMLPLYAFFSSMPNYLLRLFFKVQRREDWSSSNKMIQWEAKTKELGGSKCYKFLDNFNRTSFTRSWDNGHIWYAIGLPFRTLTEFSRDIGLVSDYAG